MTKDETGYNGWANRETWAMNLWLSNDEGLYRTLTARLQDADAVSAAQIIAEFWDELTVDVDDLLNSTFFIKTILPMILDVGSVWRVDFDEIAANWLEGQDQ